MSFESPPVSQLLGKTVSAVHQNTELFLLLSLLTGIIGSIIFGPANQILEGLFDLLKEGKADNYRSVFQALSAGITTLLFSYIAVLFMVAAALVPWARRVAPRALAPLAGGTGAFLRRASRIMIHLVSAAGLSVLVFMLLAPIIAVLTRLAPALSGAVTMVGLIFGVWAALVLNATAHLAAANEARDRRETMTSAFLRTRLFVQPMVGSYAAILFVTGMANLVFTSLLMAVVPDRLAEQTALIINFAVTFMISALHVAAMYSVPDFRDALMGSGLLGDDHENGGKD